MCLSREQVETGELKKNNRSGLDDVLRKLKQFSHNSLEQICISSFTKERGTHIFDKNLHNLLELKLIYNSTEEFHVLSVAIG